MTTFELFIQNILLSAEDVGSTLLLVLFWSLIIFFILGILSNYITFKITRHIVRKKIKEILPEEMSNLLEKRDLCIKNQAERIKELEWNVEVFKKCIDSSERNIRASIKILKSK